MTTYDLRMRATARPSAPSERVVLVNIDDDSVRRMEPLVGRWPWPRLAHASLINFLTRGGARLVVYDVLFTEADKQRFTLGGETAADGTVTGGEEWTGAESDQAFADAVKEAGNVVLAADARAEGLVDESRSLAVPLDGIPSLSQPYSAGDCIETRPQLTPPIAGLAAAARGLGHSFMVLDPDGPIRRMIPFVRVGDRRVPSLSVSAALLAQGLGPEAVASVDRHHLRIGESVLPLIETTLQGEASDRGSRVPRDDSLSRTGSARRHRRASRSIRSTTSSRRSITTTAAPRFRPIVPASSSIRPRSRIGLSSSVRARPARTTSLRFRFLATRRGHTFTRMRSRRC